MRDSAKERRLIELHAAFWQRKLDRPIINVNCSTEKRMTEIPALAAQWQGRGEFFLKPGTLNPEAYQPAPVELDSEEPACGDVAFNALVPYFRVPWLVGIMGCGIKISESSQTAWAESYLPGNWPELDDQGFKPRLEWLDKLLEFLGFIVEKYHPRKCIAAPDVIARGPGDLCLAMLGHSNFYTGMYDYPEQLHKLMRQIVDLYVRWGRAQMQRIPEFRGGYVNQYGMWAPGTCIRTQEDYACNLSKELFDEFLKPGMIKVAESFDYPVLHTHTGYPQLVEWTLDVEEMAAFDVVIDPTGPTLEESIPLWNRVLRDRALIVCGPVTEQELDMLLASLTPVGLWLDVDIITEEQRTQAFEFGTA